MKENQRKELLKHLAASLQDTKEQGGAILLVGAGISVSAGIPPAQELMKIAIENFSNYFTEEEQLLSKEDLNQLKYNDIMTKLSPMHRKALFEWHIKGDKKRNISPSKLNFAHLAIAELLKQGYIKRILTTNFDPLLINACYMVGMYPLPAIYDIGSVNQINPELFDDPCIIYLNGQHAGQVQRNTSSQLNMHDPILQKVIVSTGCKRPWIVAGYSGENDPLMDALNELRPFNNWLYWLEYSNQIPQTEMHSFLRNDEECKIIYQCDADETFMNIISSLGCKLEFIETPQTEFKNLFKNINFESAGGNSSRYINLIEKMIEVLNTPEIKRNIDQVVSIEEYENAIEASLNQFLLIEDYSIQSISSYGILEKLDEAYEHTKNPDYFIKKANVYISLYYSSNKKKSNYLISAEAELETANKLQSNTYFYKNNLLRLKVIQNQLDKAREIITEFTQEDMNKAWGSIIYSNEFSNFRDQNPDIINMILKPKKHPETFATPLQNPYT